MSGSITNVAEALIEQAQTQPKHAALRYPARIRQGIVDYRSLSYRELDRLSNRWARGLREIGIDRGMRTALMVPPGPRFFALFFALFKTGAVPVVIDPGIGAGSLRTCLDEAAPEAFIGVTRAQAARVALRWARASVRHTVTLGPRLGWSGHTERSVLRRGGSGIESELTATRPEDMAAILFTSGSTGIPKGVVYRHRHFCAQVDILRETFAIAPGEVSLPTFPPFALFDPALGMTSVIPAMNPTRPAQADPDLLLQAITQYSVTTIFGSPALLRVLANAVTERNLKLPTVQRIISAGAAVPTQVIRELEPALSEQARIHTPYGATECLPVSSISNREITVEVEALTRQGAGICVGRPIAGNRVRIIPILDGPIEHIDDLAPLEAGETGEVIVNGPTTTDRYWQRPTHTRLAKIRDGNGSTWHRMGDVGYLDAQGALWFCGRVSQRVRLEEQTLHTDQLEAIFNTHPEVHRSALVRVTLQGKAVAVLCVELLTRQSRAGRRKVEEALRQMARNNPRTASIDHFLFHPAFPVDIRHNAKIGRETLSRWASRKLK